MSRGKGCRQDTNSEWSHRTEIDNLTARLKKLEKENRQLRKQVKKANSRVEEVEGILDDEEVEKYENSSYKKKEIVKHCPKCENTLGQFTIQSPMGLLHFEKCSSCPYRKRVKR